MSFNSEHMNHPLSGDRIRAGVDTISLDELMSIPLDVLRKPDPNLYGSTKWPDYVIMRFYFENRGSISASAKDLGTTIVNFGQRLGRINNLNFQRFYEAFEKSKKNKTQTYNAYYKDVKSPKHMTAALFKIAFNTLGGNKPRIMKALKINERMFYYWQTKLEL